MDKWELAKEQITILIDKFNEQHDFFKSNNYNETQTRRDFIDPFFKALGWDMENEKQELETYRDVKHEDKIKINGHSKSPDYSFNIKGKDIIAGNVKFYPNDLSFKNYLYPGFGYGFGYLVENLIYLELRRAGYEVYTGNIKNKEVDFVANKADRVIYVQCAYLLAEPETILREYGSLEAINDHYEKYIVTLDDLVLPSNKGIRHIQAWNFVEQL